MVNLLRGWQLPSYSGLMEHFRFGNSGEAIWEAREATEKALLRIIKSHSDFCRYIFGKSPDEEIDGDELSQATAFYETFRADRETLLQTVERLSKKTAAQTEEKTFINIISAQVLIQIDKDGRLIFENIGFKNFENLDLRRFKICPVCADIFWAFRSDKKPCPKCSNAFHQSAHRDKNKEEINEKRRRAYAYKKTIKQQKEK